MPSLDDATKFIVANWIAIAVVVVVLFLAYTYYYKSMEPLSPGDTFRYQRASFSGSEALMPTRADSVFSNVNGGADQQSMSWIAGVVPGQGMSHADILASPDIGCSSMAVQNAENSTGAWAWMNGVAHESLVARPRTDNDLSLVMSGY